MDITGALLTSFAVLIAVAGSLWFVRMFDRKLIKESEPTSKDATLRDLEVRLKSIEMEWAVTYEKLSKIAGRLTKERGLAQNAVGTTSIDTRPSRSELLLRKPDAR